MPDTIELRAHIAALVNAIPDPIFIMGQDGTYLDVIGGKERSIYADASPLIGKNYFDILPEKTAQRFLHVVQTSLEEQRLIEIEYQLSNEDVRGITVGNLPKKGQWYEARVYPIKADIYNQPAVIWLSINISSRKHTEEKLAKISSHDQLTGLYNRSFFLQMVDEELQKSILNNSSISLAKINLDCFNNITDIYGLQIADEAICMSAAMIQKAVANFGHVGRLNCDQFLILFSDMKANDALNIIKIAQDNIKSHTIVLPDGTSTYLTSHAGITEKHSASDNSKDLLKRTNLAIKDTLETRSTIKIG